MSPRGFSMRAGGFALVSATLHLVEQGVRVSQEARVLAVDPKLYDLYFKGP